MKIQKLRKRSNGFTLVELVIVIAIVIVLSVVSVPIYRSYVDKAKMSEGYALLGTILTAQKAYYSEYGNFLRRENSSEWTSYEPKLGIDARGNKYITWFCVGSTGNTEKYYFNCEFYMPSDMIEPGKTELTLLYNITKGVKFNWWPSETDSSWNQI